MDKYPNCLVGQGREDSGHPGSCDIFASLYFYVGKKKERSHPQSITFYIIYIVRPVSSSLLMREEKFSVRVNKENKKLFYRLPAVTGNDARSFF